MQQIRAIIFDFDGVLVDSEPLRFKAGAQALAEIGVSLTWELFLKHWFGRTDNAGLREILGDRFEAHGRMIVARKNLLYGRWLDDVPSYPDSMRLVQRTPDAIRLAVATGSRRPEVDRILARIGLSGRFRAVVTAEDYAQAKPAPDPFLAAARRLGVEPPACLVVEDTPAGVAAGRAAGMQVLAVDRGRGGLGLDKADWLVQTLDVVGLSPEGEVVVGSSG